MQARRRLTTRYIGPGLTMLAPAAEGESSPEAIVRDCVEVPGRRTQDSRTRIAFGEA